MTTSTELDEAEAVIAELCKIAEALTPDGEIFRAIYWAVDLLQRLPSERRAREEAERERDRAVDEACELRREPWPEWAEKIKNAVRDASGYDGYDDATDGVDLPAEVDDLINEFNSYVDKARKANDRATAAEQRVKALEEALGALGDGADMVAKKAFIVQPFLAIWKKHGTLIEECRARPTQENSND